MGMFDYVCLDDFLKEKVKALCPKAKLNDLQSKCGPCIMTELSVGKTFSYIDFKYGWDKSAKSGLYQIGITSELGALVHENEQIVTWEDDFQISFYDLDYNFVAYYRDGAFYKLHVVEIK